MDVLIKHLTRRRSGDAVSRDEEITCEVLRFGRGTGNEIELSDPRVLLQQGELHARPGGLFFEAPPRSNVSIDGRIATSGHVRPGSVIEIGPYDVTVLDAPEGKDAAVSIELTRPAGDALEALQARSVMSLKQAGWGARRWAWGLSILVLALFLAWPLAQFLTGGTKVDVSHLGESSMDMGKNARPWPVDGDLVWDTGEISRPHKFIGSECGACHQKPFVQVEDSACASCHARIEHHFDPGKFKLAEVTEASCQNCHKEHAGPEPIILASQEFCADCHDNLKTRAPQTELANATDFGINHPQFRPAVVVDGDTGRTQRLTLDPKNWPVEVSNLKFPHDKHLKPEGVRVRAGDRNEKKTKVMVCADCHQTEAGGVNMRPIGMEKHCSECHQLAFSPEDPTRSLPHGDLDQALLIVRDFYADLALRGGVREDAAPASVRRRPGTPLRKEDRPEALAWAREKADEAHVYISRSVCGACHDIARTGNEDNKWRIKKVKLAESWLEKSWFPHNQHDVVECTACHKAESSKQAADVLMPGIETCRNCHGGDRTTAQIPSTCVDCHLFHLPGQPAMSKPTMAAVK
jgi:predicted CXXCH cytochrome family protein